MEFLDKETKHKTKSIERDYYSSIDKMVNSISKWGSYTTGYDNRYDDIEGILNQLYSKVELTDDNKSSDLVDKFSSIRKSSLLDVDKYKKVYQNIDKLGNRTNTYKFIKMVRSISNKIGDYVRNQSITSIDDLILLEIKLNSISKVMARFEFSRELHRALNGRVDITTIMIKNEDLDKLKTHKKYIDSILN